MSGLTQYDKRHWFIVPTVIKYLEDRIPKGARVLELGPGDLPGRGLFARADMFVDVDNIPSIAPDKLIKCDIATDPLPFADKEFDFIYCRHVLEDLYNPFLAVREMSRVGKAGYIETPSPMIEMTRGADGPAAYRGYHHHHWFVWNHGAQLRFLAKYCIIEHAQMDESGLLALLRMGPKYWNTYHLWEGEIDWQFRQNVAHFDMRRDYHLMLTRAMQESVKSTDDFWQKLPKQVEIKQMLPRIGDATTKEIAA